MGTAQITSLRNPTALNILDFRADPTGATDSTTAISSARAAARALGGARIVWPAGTYISGNQDISNDKFIYHEGAGVGATIIKLKNGANTDLFSAQTSMINSSSSAGVLYNFGFSKMTLDGNKANQSSGPSYPLRIYGYSFKHSDLEIRNGYSGNWINDWNGGNNFATDSMEAQIMNVKTHDSGGIGVSFLGPHDSQFLNLIPETEGSHCLHLGPNAGGCEITNLHAWYPGVNQQPLTTFNADTFDRANQSGWGTASGGGAWTATAGSTLSLSIISNTGAVAGTNNTSGIAYIGATHTNMEVKADINQGGDSSNVLGVFWRVTDYNNLYYAVAYQGTLYVGERVASVDTHIATFAMPGSASATQTIRAQMNGSSIRVKMWVTSGQEHVYWDATLTDTALPGPGYVGLGSTFIDGGSPFFDNFTSTDYPYQYASVLCEAPLTVFKNAYAESSAFAQVVLLGNNIQWDGRILNSNVNYNAIGLMLGIHAGDAPFPGMMDQSGGVALDAQAADCIISADIENNANVLVWSNFDGGGNRLNIHASGTSTNSLLYTGTIASNSSYDFEHSNAHLYSDGTLAKGGGMRLTRDSTQAFQIANDSAAILNVDTSTPKVQASNMQLGASSTLYSGTGAPSNSNGANGDFYFRTDAPGTANQRLYVKSSGAWVGVV